ncbi:MAG: SRPBCC family protein [Bacteroidales bacterium]
METSTSSNTITVETRVHATLQKVWECWTEPEHIVHWNFAGEDWHCPTAENDLQPGGKFSWRMEAKDGSMGFDFSGTYILIHDRESIRLTLDDDRKVHLQFRDRGGIVEIIEIFEPESVNELSLQRQGWQAILDNFRKYTESLSTKS